MNMRRVGIIGASTPQAIELMRVLSIHPMIEVVFIADDLLAGELIVDRFPGLAVNLRGAFVELDIETVKDVDLVFCALPLDESLDVVPTIRRGAPDTRIVDLSALFRPGEKELFHRLYGQRHTAPELWPDFAYGVTEGRVDDIRETHNVAVPGEIASALIVALAPLAHKGLLSGKVQVSAQVGSTAFSAPANTVETRRILDEPQVLEATTWLAQGDDAAFELALVTQSMPQQRGVLATIFVEVSSDLAVGTLDSIYREHYENSLVVRQLATAPELKHVLDSRRVHFNVRLAGEALVFSVALDNLGFGGAMQGVACANLMLGLPEEAGLMFPGRSL